MQIHFAIIEIWSTFNDTRHKHTIEIHFDEKHETKTKITKSIYLIESSSCRHIYYRFPLVQQNVKPALNYITFGCVDINDMVLGTTKKKEQKLSQKVIYRIKKCVSVCAFFTLSSHPLTKRRLLPNASIIFYHRLFSALFLWTVFSHVSVRVSNKKITTN